MAYSGTPYPDELEFYLGDDSIKFCGTMSGYRITSTSGKFEGFWSGEFSCDHDYDNGGTMTNVRMRLDSVSLTGDTKFPLLVGGVYTIDDQPGGGGYETDITFERTGAGSISYNDGQNVDDDPPTTIDPVPIPPV